jgi:hypothetical protein
VYAHVFEDDDMSIIVGWERMEVGTTIIPVADTVLMAVAIPNGLNEPSPVNRT